MPTHGKSTIGSEAKDAKRLYGAGPSKAKSKTRPSDFCMLTPKLMQARGEVKIVYGDAVKLWKKGGGPPDDALVTHAAHKLHHDCHKYAKAFRRDDPTLREPKFSECMKVIEAAADKAFGGQRAT